MCVAPAYKRVLRGFFVTDPCSPVSWEYLVSALWRNCLLWTGAFQVLYSTQGVGKHCKCEQEQRAVNKGQENLLEAPGTAIRGSVSTGEGPVEPEWAGAGKWPPQGGQYGRVCSELWGCGCLGCPGVWSRMRPGSWYWKPHQEQSKDPRVTFSLNMVAWPHPFTYLHPLPSSPSPMALKKLAKPNSTRTMRTGEELTASKRY